jgi:mono/diheme cytochrome c family protein
VGRKLNKEALVDALNGNIHVRPHMYIRMPKFAADSVESLPSDLIKADAAKTPTTKTFSGDISKLAGDGRTLFDTGCVQCHPVRGENLPGVVGIDLAGAAKRLKPNWFHDFLLNPVALKERTRMPTFFPDGRSVNAEILDGDTERQIAALWAYVVDIENQPLPQKIIDGKAHDFELVPGERPILLRTFMKNVGTHAIAVGFGEKVHCVFDAEAVRPAQAWRGRFLDAHGTWFDRFTPPAVPLGDDLVDFPDGVPFAVLPDRQTPWPAANESAIRFGGFRLDKSGVPTFLYRVGAFDIEDRLAPDQQGRINRSITVTSLDRSADHQAELFFRATAGTSIRRENATSYTNQDALRVTVAEPLGSQGILREFNGIHEWVIPIQAEGETLLEVEYQW